MKKISAFLALIICVSMNSALKADEGLWLMSLINKLNYADMQKMGLKLNAEEIYNFNNNSIKDAIVQFNSGCSGSVISESGLLITAYHCGLDYIQFNSEVKNNYIDNGFWAKSRYEEIACPGLTVTFLIKMENVTDKVLLGIDSKTDLITRKAKINESINLLTQNATKKNHYTAEIKSFYEGKEYYLFIYETFKDIRLVGAPPKSIGNFGGETDNWTWPRHTGDFSIFRIYTDQNGNPAEYAKDNQPLKPKYFLPISISGVKENDFTMSIGYPGKTNRYASSLAIEIAQKETSPAIIALRDAKLEIISKFMEQSNENYLKYLPKFNHTSNYWKYYKEQMLNIEYLDIINKKIFEEKTYENWATMNNKKDYLKAYQDILSNTELIRKYHLNKIYYNEAILRGTEILALANKFMPLYNELKNSNKIPKKKREQIALAIIESLKDDIREYVRNTDFNTDKSIMAAQLKLYQTNIKKEQLPDIFDFIDRNHYNNTEVYANYVYNTSFFANIDKLWNFVYHPTLAELENDPCIKIILSCQSKLKEIDNLLIESNNQLAEAKRIYIQGLMEMQPEKQFYPDGNSSMRLTYGKVSGYVPADGLIADYKTTFDGIMEKTHIANIDYNIPKNMLLFQNYRDYDKYGEKNMLPTCFITDNDISGGFSGAPMLNARGELIGVVFDLNKEAISSEFYYTKNMHRTICLDIKYALFIMDKVYKANYITGELKISNN